MKIKKILFPLAIFLLLSSGCSYTVRQVKGRPSQSLNGGIFYSLPKTKIRVAVTFEYTNFDMAPYVDYAEKYLGIEVDDSRAWEIADVDITAVYEADPDHYYYVEPRNSKISVQVSEKGLLKSINSPFVEITAPDENVVERVEKINLSEYLYSTANYNMHERVDTLYAPGKGSENEESMVYVRSSVKKNEEQRAEETAKKISEIQQKKMEILYGEYESSYNENALNFVYSSLEREEKRLMQLFTGVKNTFTDVFYVEPELSKVVVDDQIVELFRFSPQEGIVDSTNEDAMPIYCNLTVENNLRAVSRYAKGKSGKGYLKKVSPKTNTSTFKYRIPEVVRVSFVTPSFTKQKTVKVSQFGTILELPARNVEAVFDSHTGELQYIRNR
ncbi:MAG: DUF4831 family protein [Bacteroidales bacterium]|nr:DUF4831 family protein [Bacteroidales bacterium]